MASIANDPDGRRRILFVDHDGKRKTIRLGRLSQKSAEAVCRHVEALLAAKISGQPIPRDTAAWLSTLGDALRDKLARVGLVAAPKRVTLGEFLAGWLEARRTSYKPASLTAWGLVVDALTRFFGRDRRITSLTHADGEQFRQHLIAAGLRPTTIHKRLQHARMFFAHAKREGLIAANPFEYVRHRPSDPQERRAYIPAADALRVIDYCPNAYWRLLVALARFGGLRVPSEVFSLKWADVDWERGRLAVPSPKTEHLGKPYRVIPLFSTIRPYLEAVWELAPEGAVYVFPDEYRRRAHGPRGWANANLRTTLGRVIRRAGLEPWPRLWHSLRASCETDLARHFPLAVVVKWLGNTQAVAMRHYVDVTDADFERALRLDGGPFGVAQKAAQQTAEIDRNEAKSPKADFPQALNLQPFAADCGIAQFSQMEDRGIEHTAKNPENQRVDE